MIKSLKRIRICVGTGENHYTISRGSFRYRQSIHGSTLLGRGEETDIPGGFSIPFRHAQEVFTFLVRKRNGTIRAALQCPKHTKFNRYEITFRIREGLHIYGCGEVHAGFDLAGQKVRVFVAEHQNADRIGKKMIRKGLLLKSAETSMPLDQYESYYAQPTFTTSDRWFFHSEAKGYSEFDFTVPGQVTYRTQEPPVFWIGKADSFELLSEKLSSLLGRQRFLPDWIYDGAILAVQGGTYRIEQKIRAAQEGGAKICGVWSQDWCGFRRTDFGYQVMWNWQRDRGLYQDLNKKIPEWKAKGIHFLGYINPFMAVEKDLYRYASRQGYCVKNQRGEDYLVTITTFPAAMIDLTNPKAWEWYKDIIKRNLIGIGMDGWMADFGEYLPVDCVLHSGQDPYLLHNRWPAMWAKLNAEAIREAGKEREVFFFTRAGYTQTPMYSPMMWTGDHHVDWSEDDGIGSVIPATLSLAMSGFGVTHSDVGGYTTISRMTRSRELLARWEEMNVFSPLMRFHEGNRPWDNIQPYTDRGLIAQLSWCSRAHAALKPYLQQLETENCTKGVPVMRPLFYHYDEDAAYREKTEYLLGRDILVAPILKQGAASRRVWLPEDRWVHLFTEQEYGGGEHEIEAPVGTPPVFIRKDSSHMEIADRIREIWRGDL